MTRTVVEADEAPGENDAVARRRAVTETRAVLAQASAVWAPYACPGSAECCQLATTGRPPWLWPSEWWLLEAHLQRERRALPPVRGDGGCPFLDAAGRRCTVYEARPFGCRTFFCPRGVGPARAPSAATHGLLERLAALNLALDAEAAPRALPAWHAQATAVSPSSRSPGAP